MPNSDWLKKMENRKRATYNHYNITSRYKDNKEKIEKKENRRKM